MGCDKSAMLKRSWPKLASIWNKEKRLGTKNGVRWGLGQGLGGGGRVVARVNLEGWMEGANPATHLA